MINQRDGEDTVPAFFMLDFKTIYDKYWARIAYYANKYVDNKEEAEDIAQEAFLVLSQHLDTINDETYAVNYLYLCAKNKSLNFNKAIRKEHKRQPGYLYLLETPDPEAVDAELTALMFTLIETIPIERQRIFKLIYFEGLKLQEVADKLHISINTVKSQRSKALIQLRKELA